LLLEKDALKLSNRHHIGRFPVLINTIDYRTTELLSDRFNPILITYLLVECS